MNLPPWVHTNIEECLKARLVAQFGGATGEAQYGFYTTARTKLLTDIYEEIKGRERDLSDHGPRHIRNVLENAYLLLGPSFEKLTAMELYVLCTAILFHDVGNLEGREGHNRKISEIYKHVRGGDQTFDPEKRAILQISGAHSGYSKDKTKDTIKDLDEYTHVYANPIRAKLVAAILRLADELAEGPHRTSLYIQNHPNSKYKSPKHHQYASSASYTIERSRNLIAVNYEIRLVPSAGNLQCGDLLFVDFMEFIYERLVKLDQERRYTRF